MCWPRKTSVICLALLTISPAFGADRPNVLLIITDDQNDYVLERAGVPIRTPSLDTLSEPTVLPRSAGHRAPHSSPALIHTIPERI